MSTASPPSSWYDRRILCRGTRMRSRRSGGSYSSILPSPSGPTEGRPQEETLMRLWTRSLVLSAMLLTASTAGVLAAEYEVPTNRAVKDVLPPELATGPEFTVAEPVVADGYMYTFKVNSSYGPFEVTGLGALRKLIREIWAIGQLRHITGSEAFMKSLADQATKPVQFAKNVVTKPGETISGIPKGVGRLFSNVSTAVSSAPDPSQDSRTKELLLIGSFKRDYAARYHVDPYSSNKVLQEELDKIGKAAAFGSWTASAAMMPIGGAAGAVLSATSLSQSFNNILQAEPPSRIRTINEQKLQEMGIPPELAKQFLDHPVYTPRQDLILVDSLARLSGVTGRDAYLRAALTAADEDEANFFVNMAQIMRGYHATRSPLTRITMLKVLPVAQSKSGAALVPFALDYGVWTANADRISQHLKSNYRPQGFKGQFELWVTGAMSPTARQELQARGITVLEQVGSRIDIVD